MEDEEMTVARELQETLDEGATIPVQRIRAWMSSSSPGVRSLVFSALFEGKAAFFSGWKADPVLAAAYEEAITLSS